MMWDIVLESHALKALPVVNPGFSDLFAALNDPEVRYLVNGAYAVALYPEPRYANDLDV